MVPPFALVYYNAGLQIRTASDEAKKTALRLARLAAQTHEDLIDQAHGLLLFLSHLPLLDPLACKNLLADLPQRYPSFTNFAVSEPSGKITCSSLPFHQGITFENRAWFKEVLQRRSFVASDYVIGRITNQPMIVFALPVLSDSGAVRAVISAAVVSAGFSSVSRDTILPPGSVFTVIDRQGTVLARQPDHEKWVGKPYPEIILIKTMLAQNREGVAEYAGLDGILRLYAFISLGKTNGVEAAYLNIGIPRDAAYVNAHQVLKQNLIWMGLVTVLVLTALFIGSRLVLNRVEALVGASKRLAAGDLGARTGLTYEPDEIGQVAEAFDRMAEALQKREVDKKEDYQIRARLAGIVESSNDAIIGISVDGTVTSWNKGAENLFHYSSEEMIGRKVLELVPPDHVEQVIANIEQTMRGERVGPYVTVRLRKGGEPVSVSVTVSPIIDAHGGITGGSAIVRDISERKRVEDELRKQTEILQKTFDHIPIMINFTGEDGRIKLVNREWERTLGWTLEEIETQDLDIFAECCPDPTDRQEVRDFIAAATGEWGDFKLRVKDGRTIETTWAETKLSDGTVIGIGVDITGRTRTARQIKALHQINLAITSTLDLPIILQFLLQKIDILMPYAAAHLRLIDPATGALEPFACRNIDEKKWKSVAGKSRGSLTRIIIGTKKPLIVLNMQTDDRVKQHELYKDLGLVSYLGLPMIFNDEVIGVLAVFTANEHEFTRDEINFMKALAEQASIAIHNSQLYEQSQKLAQDLLANRRQIRTLLTGLINARDEEAERIARVLHDESGQLLAAAYIMLDELARAVPVAQERVKKTKELLDGIEERLRNLSHELHPTILNNLGFPAALDYLTAQVSQRSEIRITTECATNGRLSPPLDLTLYRVIQEALNNAIRHSKASHVQIRVFEDEPLVQCSIEDNGIGFDPVALSRPAGQPGLGLAGIRERVESFNGNFEIFSAPGAGTKLFITFPQEKIDGVPSAAGG